MSFLTNLFGGSSSGASSKYKQTQLPNMAPNQMELLNQLIGGIKPGVSGGIQYLNKLASGDESLFQQLEAPAHRQFEENLGKIGNRYSHLGAQDSNYFENAVSGEGAKMAENLASQRMGLQNQAIKQLLGQSNQLLGAKPYEYGFEEKNPFEGIPGLEMLGEYATPENISMLIKLIPLLLA